MKKLLIGLVLLFISLPALAQDAMVIELTPEESVTAQKAWKNKEAADNDWTKVDAAIQQKYRKASAYFTFSTDFRFLVPTARVWFSDSGSAPPVCASCAITLPLISPVEAK